MKNLKLITIIGLLLVLLAPDCAFTNTANTGMRDITSLQLTADMGAGWNLGNTLDAYGDWVSGLDTETCWGNPKTTKAMVDAIRQKGFKTLRVPVTWHQHLGTAPEYTIDPAWLDRVEEVANYAFANDMYVVINVHHDDSWVIPTYEKQDAVINQLSKVWTQIANRFINYSDYLIFETLNEPRLVGSQNEWMGGDPEGRDVLNKFHLAAVNAIRNTGGNNESRHIMISPYGANGGEAPINDLVIPNNDSRIIISWHNYYPYNFALQIPGSNTWGADWEKNALIREFDRIYNKFIKNGRAVIIGEWGATDKNNTEERKKYAAFFVNEAKKWQMPTIWWDNGDLEGGDSNGGFAIFNRKKLSWHYPTIADAIIENMGGTVNVTGVNVSPDKITLRTNTSKQLSALITPANATNKSVDWTSANIEIAKVDDKGLVTAIAVGTTTIIITTEDGNFQDVCYVTVSDEVTTYQLTTSVTGFGKITLSPEGDIYPEGAEVTLTAIANEGWSFVNWTGDISETSANISIVMDEDKSVTANFTEVTNPCDNPTPITLNFKYSGAGEYCWVTSEDIEKVNSWNTNKIEINGVDYTNTWSNQMPAKINEKYYISYSGDFDWSHFEATTTEKADGPPSITVNAYPNPFSEKIVLQIDKPQNVKGIDIIDKVGRIVESYNATEILPIMHVGDNLSSGVYYLRTKTNHNTKTQTITKD